MTNALRDQNRITVALGVSNADATVTLPFKIDSVTGRVLVDATSGGGITIGTTTITSGTNGRVLYDNNGVVGEMTTTGSGTVNVLQTSPSLITPTLGVATATSINGNTFTAGTYTLTGQAGKTLSFNGSITLTGTDAQTYTFPTTSATIARTDAANTFTGHQTIEGVTTTGATGTGKLVFDGTPTLVTPILGVATATTINGNTFTTGTYTLTGTAAKTLNFTNTLTLSGTDSTTMTFPATTATIARTDAAQTFTGTQTFSQVNLTANAITASGNAATVPITSGRNIVTNNSAATLTITLTTGAVNMQTCMLQILDFSAVAQTLVFVNTENSTVTVPTTSNGSTTLPLTLGFIYNSATSKWRYVTSA